MTPAENKALQRTAGAAMRFLRALRTKLNLEHDWETPELAFAEAKVLQVLKSLKAGLKWNKVLGAAADAYAKEHQSKAEVITDEDEEIHDHDR